MGWIKDLTSRLVSVNSFLASLNIRKRIVCIILAFVFMLSSLLTFGPTLIFICGTTVGVWCALKLKNKHEVLDWDRIIPKLPHIAKERPLYDEAILQEIHDDLDHGRIYPRNNDIPTVVQNETGEYVRLMMRDFLLDWYRILSDDDQFSHNVFLHFKGLIKNAKSRFGNVDQRKFLCSLLGELRAHVDIYRRLLTSRKRLATRSSKLGKTAKQHSVVSIYETFSILHPALQSSQSEKDHLTQLADTLILALLPSDLCECSALVLLLQDFLSSNLLQTVVDLVSDPDFLNEVFIILLSDEPLKQSGGERSNKNGADQIKRDVHRKSVGDARTGHNEVQEISSRTTGTDNTVMCPSKLSDITSEEDISGIKSNAIPSQPSTKGNVALHNMSDKNKEKSASSLAEASGNEINEMQKIVSSQHLQSSIPLTKESEDISHETIKIKLPMTMLEPSSPTARKNHREEHTCIPQQIICPMPMTMIEPSKPVSTKDVEPVKSISIEKERNDVIDGEISSAKSEESRLHIDKIFKKFHRRSASADCKIISLPGTAPVLQHAANKELLERDFCESSTSEAMRSCFSADCITQLDDHMLTSQGKLSSSTDLNPSSSSKEEILPSRAPDERHVQFQPSPPSSPSKSKADNNPGNIESAEQIQAGEGCDTDDLSKTAPAEELTDAPHPVSHPSPGGEMPLEWATWKVTNLEIPTTSWIGDASGKKPIVYFVMKYKLLKKPTMSDDSRVTFSSSAEMEVRRRYREFVNLHARISSKPTLRRKIRGITNIPKQPMLPMTRLSPAMEEEKKSSLESYVIQLLERPMVHNSREMAEFLAIDGDAHIEFVRKSSSQLPRIDKLLMTQAKGFVGTIKTMLPERQVNAPGPEPLPNPPPQPPSSSTTSHPQPSHVTESHDHRRSSLKMQLSHDGHGPIKRQASLPVLDGVHLVGGEDVLDWTDRDATRIRLFGLDETKESNVQRAMQLLLNNKHDELSQRAPLPPPPGRDKDKHSFLGPRSAGDGSDAPDAPLTEGLGEIPAAGEGHGDVELYEAVYGVLSEAMLNQQSALLDENVQTVLRNVIGALIDRWLEQEVGLLFTEAQWGYYLSLLRDLLWPEGVWGPRPRETKTTSDKAKTKAEALHELTHNVLSSALSLVIGEEAVGKGFSLMLDSFQDKELNKHLVFLFLDYAMDQLIPEVQDPKFQDSLAAMP